MGGWLSRVSITSSNLVFEMELKKELTRTQKRSMCFIKTSFTRELDRTMSVKICNNRLIFFGMVSVLNRKFKRTTGYQLPSLSFALKT